MPLFIGAAVKFVATFLSNIANHFIAIWIRMRESRKRGEAEAKNVAHEENARRKAKSDGIMAQPIKKGKALIDSIRNRGNTA